MNEHESVSQRVVNLLGDALLPRVPSRNQLATLTNAQADVRAANALLLVAIFLLVASQYPLPLIAACRPWLAGIAAVLLAVGVFTILYRNYADRRLLEK